MAIQVTNVPMIPIESIIYSHSDRQLCEKACFYLNDNKTKKAISILEKISKKYPDNQVVYNNLSAAYLRDGREDLADEITRKVYNKYPRYLYAMINLSHIYLEQGETNKVKEIFENKFEIDEVFPDRDVFHSGEVEQFYLLMGRYNAMIGNLDQARHLRDYLEHFHPTGTAFKMVDDFITTWEYVYSKQNNSDSIN